MLTELEKLRKLAAFIQLSELKGLKELKVVVIFIFLLLSKVLIQTPELYSVNFSLTSTRLSGFKNNKVT